MTSLLLRLRADRGDTLIEILVTVSILAIAVVAIVGGFGTSIFMSDTQRKEATEQTILRNYVEAVQGMTTWVGCATPAAYTPSQVGLTGYSTPYVPTATAVQYWNGSAFTSTCSSDTGLQKITLQVQAPPRATESIDVVKRCTGARGSGGCP